MRLLVYTAVFGDYDRVYPPVEADPEIDYVIITDDPDMQVHGWTTRAVDAGAFATPKAANLYHRALIHRILPGYDASIYVDGNIRVLGSTRALFRSFLAAGKAVGTFPHPLRKNVAEEVESCIQNKKAEGAERLRQEYQAYLESGFDDHVGLFETGVLLKNHKVIELDTAMECWNACFAAYRLRDQVSLPYALWRSGVEPHRMNFNFRERNPYFGIYPHKRGRDVNPIYAHVYARSYDSWVYAGILRAWQLFWSVKRLLRGSGR